MTRWIVSVSYLNDHDDGSYECFLFEGEDDDAAGEAADKFSARMQKLKDKFARLRSPTAERQARALCSWSRRFEHHRRRCGNVGIPDDIWHRKRLAGQYVRDWLRRITPTVAAAA